MRYYTQPLGVRKELSILERTRRRRAIRLGALMRAASEASLSAGHAVRAGNLITNGSFELPVIAPPSYTFIGYCSFTGWNGYSPATTGANACGLSRGMQYGWPDYDGEQVFSQDGGDAPPGAWIEQTFATIPGQLYEIDFMCGRSGFSTQAPSLNAQVFDSGNQQLASLTAVPPSTAGWLAKTFNFLADLQFSRLCFTDTSGSNPGNDLHIDAVSATAIPGPASLALFGAGALALWLRRRKTP
jgi:hypothetical protein